MANKTFDFTDKDSQAMPVEPLELKYFDIARFEAHAAEADDRFAAFMEKDEGVAVWQRVRVGEVFRDGCRDMAESLRWQLDGLKKSLEYKTDAPSYLEPWYGIGTTAASWGADYVWHEGQAPATYHVFDSIDNVPAQALLDFTEAPVTRFTLETIEYFLDATQGRLPISWSDIQAPINVVGGGLVDVSRFFMAFYQNPDKVRQLLQAAAAVLTAFLDLQTELIGDALSRPGHGFASSRQGVGVGLSTDNLVMLSPKMYEKFCIPIDAEIGVRFGGVATHSCGNWGKWIDILAKNPSLMAVDGAFSPQTDPAYNQCEDFRDVLVGTGIILHARIVGDADEVLARVKRLWKPGTKLIIVTYVQDAAAQHRLYDDIHAICS